MGKSFFEIDSEEGPWATGLKTEGGNLGYHNRVKGGYFPRLSRRFLCRHAL